METNKSAAFLQMDTSAFDKKRNILGGPHVQWTAVHIQQKKAIR